MGVLIVAIIQFNSLSDQTKAITKALELISEASRRGADIVLFPEMWVNGYRFFDPADPDGHQRWRDSALHEDEEPLASIARIAKNRGIAVAIGYLRKTDGEPENSCVVFDQHGSVRLVIRRCISAISKLNGTVALVMSSPSWTWTRKPIRCALAR